MISHRLQLAVKREPAAFRERRGNPLPGNLDPARNASIDPMHPAQAALRNLCNIALSVDDLSQCERSLIRLVR